MKNNLKSFFAFSVILLLASCEVGPKEEDFLEAKIEPYYSLEQLLLKAVPSENKPNRVTHYQLESFINHNDIYYDSEENELLNVYLNESLDTTSIVLFVYSDGLLLEKNAYPKDDSGYELTETFKYHYNSDGSLHQITRNGGIHMLYNYNDEALVSEIIFGPNTNLSEGYYFYYDEAGRITRQIWGISDQLESPIRDWHYIYDESGKLISKSIPVSSHDNLEPMFVYSFDNQDRMTEELELYPEYGFSPYFKTIYSYSLSN
ncbi:hypothetical protein [Algoriphagus chordae]|uniref:YD repeat-containing protein n=1 Tax=Algoriphagus chordae TaxID=237019 RepID=A0A2W7RKZ0_9BACT|nr:hypothetical protein [Algoriphagus chordae]PZX51345.1 hypothetical protein LV85_02289 [Algoriphagus chordae]